MARVNVYLPDELASKARAAKLNISALAQDAVEGALKKNAWAEWLAQVRRDPPTGITHEEIMKVMDEVHDEMWGEDDKPENYRRLG